MKLKPQHISTLVVSLADFVRMADRKIIASTLSQLKLELDFDSTAISQLQVVLFGFQDAVSVEHKTVTEADKWLHEGLQSHKSLLIFFTPSAVSCSCSLATPLASAETVGSEHLGINLAILHKQQQAMFLALLRSDR